MAVLPCCGGREALVIRQIGRPSAGTVYEVYLVRLTMCTTSAVYVQGYRLRLDPDSSASGGSSSISNSYAAQ